MSNLPVNAARVVAVLLADGWHHITPGSFTVGTLAFGPEGAGDELGYDFEEAASTSPYGPATFAGPLSAVLAMRQAPLRALATRVRPRRSAIPRATVKQGEYPSFPSWRAGLVGSVSAGGRPREVARWGRL
jgi:hypothetical protein